MTRFLIGTCLMGALLAFLATSALKTLHLSGQGLGASSADLFNLDTLQALNLQKVTVGGKVITVSSKRVLVSRRGRVVPIVFAPRATFSERGQPVSQAAIEVGVHLTAQSLATDYGYAAYRVKISPHRYAIGGRIESNDGNVLELVGNNATRLGVAFTTVRIPSGLVVTLASMHGPPAPLPLQLQTRVAGLGYHDPSLQALDPNLRSVFIADSLHVVKPPKTHHFGGLISRIDAARGLVAIYDKVAGQTETVEVTAQTKVTLGPYAASYADMALGDHVTVIGILDSRRPAPGPNPILAKYLRISSPTFGGVISALGPASKGGVVLTVRGRHGHILRIDAPARALVYTTIAGTQQTAHVQDLVAGEHISAKGTRLGKFELSATAIHVYPHTRTLGGAVQSVLPGKYRVLASDGSQFIARTSIHTKYFLNGVAATAAIVKRNVHIRAYGYVALRSDQGHMVTLIVSRISVTIHKHTVHKAGKSKKSTATPHPTPTPKPPASTRPTTMATPAAPTRGGRANAPR